MFASGKRSSDRVVCTNDCICENYSCPDNEIAYCKKEKSSQGDRLCDCKACSGDSGEDDDDDDDDDDD